jgi:adenylate cyclase
LNYSFEKFILDSERRELRCGDVFVPLEPQVFDLLEFLIRCRDRVVSKDELLAVVWRGRMVSESALTTRINAARAAIGDSGKSQRLIRTLPRKGIRFVGEVREHRSDRSYSERSSRDESSVVVRAEARSSGVLMGEDEGAIRSGLHNSRELVLATLESRSGRIIPTPADTVIAVFTNVALGVSAARDARDSLTDMSIGLPADCRVHYRFGVESGDPEEGDAGPGGESVERAAALVLRGHPDSIRLGESVHTALPTELAVATTKSDSGVHELASGDVSAQSKGRPVQLQSLDLALPTQPSIVLLPFKCDNHEEGEALAEGLRVDIQNALTKMSGVFLLAAGSANAMRNWTGRVAGVRAGVRYVLEGGVQQLGDQVRVNVQLTDTIAGTVLWSECYDRVLDHRFALQDEITARIVTTLDVKLASGEQARIWHKCLTDPRAREVFYRGIQSFFRMNAEAMTTARTCFERVADLVKESSIGPSNVAMALWMQATRGWTDDPRKARLLAGEWAERAIKFEDTDGQAHTVLGNVRLLQGRHDEAVKIARDAIEIRPGCNNANAFLANVLLHCGDPDAAVVHARRAIRLMPIYPPWFVEILAAAYRDSGKTDFSLIAAREILRISPSTVSGRLILVSSLVRSGWVADARRLAREILTLDNEFSLARYRDAIPYRDRSIPTRLVEELRQAGLPD